MQLLALLPAAPRLRVVINHMGNPRFEAAGKVHRGLIQIMGQRQASIGILQSKCWG